MPLDRPSLTLIRQRIEADVAARLPGIDPVLRRSLTDVLAKALAAAIHALYGHLNTIARDVFPDTARAEALERWADIYSVGRTAAAFAAGDLDVTGDDLTPIPQGTRWIRADGVEYESTTAAAISGTSATVPVEAVEGGVDGNADAGSLVSIVSPISGIDSQATVATGGITGGFDQATDEELRDELLSVIAAPPQGGSQADYERWAFDVPGVTRRWVFSPPPGSDSPLVTVIFVLDDDPVSIIPDAAKLAEMQTLLEDRRALGQRPVAAAPTLVPLNVQISALDPDTPEVRAAIQAELGDMILRDAVPGMPLLVSRIREAISIAAGESDHVLDSPTSNVAHAAGELAILGTVTFV